MTTPSGVTDCDITGVAILHIPAAAEQGGPRGKGPSKHRLRGARPPKFYTHARKLHLEPTLMATSSPADVRTAPSTKRRRQKCLDDWCKKRKDGDKESDETATTSTETPGTSVDTEGRSETDPEDLESSAIACNNVCCSCEGEAYQPKSEVILASMSNKGRRFLSSWYERFPWITICATRKKVFCIYCRQAHSLKMILFSKKGDDAFTKRGFDNYKKAIEKFRVHEMCDTHL